MVENLFHEFTPNFLFFIKLDVVNTIEQSRFQIKDRIPKYYLNPQQRSYSLHTKYQFFDIVTIILKS